MSRTTRNIRNTETGLRNPRHRSAIIMEVAALEEIQESGYTVTHNRLRNYSSRIVNAWDDIAIAGLQELYIGE